jgi:hypothetical protein
MSISDEPVQLFAPPPDHKSSSWWLGQLLAGFLVGLLAIPVAVLKFVLNALRAYRS